MSDSESENEMTSIRAPVFTKDWSLFSQMFLNYGACKGFSTVIDIKRTDPNLPESQTNLSEDPSIRKKNKAAVLKNQMAINALFVAFRKCPSLLSLVLNTSNDK